MNIDAINTRLKKNKLPELAGEDYCGMQSPLVMHLRERGKLAYLGIKNHKGEYTILGENLVYVSAEDKECEIPINVFVAALSGIAMQLGKGTDVEYIFIANWGNVWMKNNFTMTALWNTALLFNSSPPDLGGTQ